MIPVADLSAHPGNVRDGPEPDRRVPRVDRRRRRTHPAPRHARRERRVAGHRRPPPPRRRRPGGPGRGAVRHRPGPGRRRGRPVPRHAAGQQRRLPGQLHGRWRKPPRCSPPTRPEPAGPGSARRPAERPPRSRPRSPQAACPPRPRPRPPSSTTTSPSTTWPCWPSLTATRTPPTGCWHAWTTGTGLEHVAERIRQDRAEAAEHARIRADLEAAGVTVTDRLPDGAAQLDSLSHDGQDLTPESHAACPGHGATFASWNLLQPQYYCTSPAEHGHASRWANQHQVSRRQRRQRLAPARLEPRPRSPTRPRTRAGGW